MLVVLITPPPVDEDGRMEYAKYVNSSPYINCFLGRPTTNRKTTMVLPWWLQHMLFSFAAINNLI